MLDKYNKNKEEGMGKGGQEVGNGGQEVGNGGQEVGNGEEDTKELINLGNKVNDAKKKRGRKRKDEKRELVNNKDQNKFFVDVSKETDNKELISKMLVQANQKDYGREITFKDLVLAALSKLTIKDIEKLQENCLSEMEKVQRALTEFNKKNESQLTLGEFLVRKLGIN